MSELNVNIPNIPESLKQSMGYIAKISEAMQPELLQQVLLHNLTENMRLNLSQIDFSYPVLTTAMKQIQIPAMRLSELFSGYQLSSSVTAAIKALNDSALRVTSDSIINASRVMTESLLTAIRSPFVEWLNIFDYSPFQRIIESLQINIGAVKRHQELHKAYLQAMYDCEWFPYAGITADISLFREINEIIVTSRGNSKRRKARIDKAILAYYTPKEIKDIKKVWRNSDLEPHIKKILGQAVEAHLRGEYVLTITCLATMWEGLIHYKTNVTERRQSKKTKEDFVKLIAENDYEPIFSDYYENFIVSQINTNADVIEGVPNRNGVSHSRYNKYPNKKASLNAILLTDFIIGLAPKEMEV